MTETYSDFVANKIWMRRQVFSSIKGSDRAPSSGLVSSRLGRRSGKKRWQISHAHINTYICCNLCLCWCTGREMVGGGEAEGGHIHLTSVNICVRTYVSPLLGIHGVCVISVSVAAHTVRMRNFCCFLCFCFAVSLPVSASVMQCYDFYTFTHICRCLCPALVFRFFFGFSFAFPLLLGLLFWLHLNQLVAVLCLHISTSFGFSNVHFLRCLRPFYFLSLSWKFVSILSCFCFLFVETEIAISLTGRFPLLS